MINKYFHNISITLVLFLFLTFVLTTLGFILKLPVNVLYIMIASLLSLYYLKKQSDTYYDFLKQLLIIVICIFVSYILSLFFWDSTTDGRSYHMAAIILLKNGWNPIYDNIEQVTALNHLYLFNTQWGNWYVKFCEIIGANIYKVSGLIESSKLTNFIFAIATFMFSFSVLGKFLNKKILLQILISLIIVINPVCIYQILGNFIDINIYYAFTLLVFAIISLEKSEEINRFDLLMFIMSSVILSNCKFTGSVYLFIILCCYLVFHLINKKPIKIFLIMLSSIIILNLLCGINPYFTNLKNHGNILYPILGNTELTVVEINYPHNFKNYNFIKRFIYGNFGESTASLEAIPGLDKEVKLKLPLTITSNEDSFDIPDMRTGGFGYYWGGILILSLIMLPFIRFKTDEDKKIFLLVFGITALSTILNPHNWWARYVPQFWLLPVFIILFFCISEVNNKISSFLKYFLIVLMFCFILRNCYIVLAQNIDGNLQYKIYKSQFYYNLQLLSADKGIYLMKDTDYNKYFADESIIPHLKEENIKITQVPFDREKIINREFLSMEEYFFVHHRCYFYKIIGKEND